MPVTIHIPTPLRAFTDKKDAVEVDGATVSEALQAAAAHAPDQDSFNGAALLAELISAGSFAAADATDPPV